MSIGSPKGKEGIGFGGGGAREEDEIVESLNEFLTSYLGLCA